MPPQSTSVSFPFLKRSMHVGARQIEALQNLDMQSLAIKQESPFGHALHVGPPQSVSVSLPFVTLSVQLNSNTNLLSIKA